MRRLALLLVLLSIPFEAAAFRADNRVEVTPSGQDFIVQEGGGFGARGMWCAAADYALDVLGAPATARVYVTQPRRTPRDPVAFSLDPGTIRPTSFMIVGTSLRQPGANLLVGHAMSFCADARTINR